MTITISANVAAVIFGLLIGIIFAPLWYAAAAGAADAVRVFALWWRCFWWRWWRGE